jgi:hypothetical protein
VIESGYVNKKNKELTAYTYSKTEITYKVYDTEIYYDSDGLMKTRQVSRTIHTGNYNYYKHIDNADYVLTLITINPKNDKKYTTEIYVSEDYFNKIKINDYVILKEIKYEYWDYNNKREDITKDEYIKEIRQ